MGRRLLAAALGVLALTLTCLGLSTRLGGPVSVLVTSGVSMRPTITEGTLAVVVRHPPYSPGAVVAYRSGLINAVVLHRVIGRDGEQLVTRGDNNDFTDSYRPHQDEVLGQLALALPGAGTALDALRNRLAFALLTGAGLVGLALVFPRPSRLQRPARRDRGRRAGRSPQCWSSRSRRLLRYAAGLAALTVLGLLAGAAPHLTTRLLTVDTRTQWSYNGSATTPGVYDGGAATSGQTVYTRVVPRLTVDWQQSFPDRVPVMLSGRAGTEVVLWGGSGWSHTVQRTPWTAVTGTGPVRGSVTIEPRGLLLLAADISRRTGVVAEQLSVEVRPVLDGELSAGRRVIPAPLPKPLLLHLDATTLKVDAQSALTTTTPVELPAQVQAVRSLPLLGLRIPVRQLTTLTGLSALLLLGAALQARRPQTPTVEAAARAEGLYVHACRPPLVRAGEPVVELTDARQLVHIAAVGGSPLLRCGAGPTAEYVVREGGTCYRFQPSPAVPAPPPRPRATPTCALLPGRDSLLVRAATPAAVLVPAPRPPAEGPPTEGPPAEGPPTEGPPAEGRPVPVLAGRWWHRPRGRRDAGAPAGGAPA